jgi:mono/diheme cytochrome c family protein
MRHHLVFALSALLFMAAIATTSLAQTAAPQGGPADRARSAALFARIATVLEHPRCLNCHTSTDFPRQGDDRHPHIMQVKRGADGGGHPALRCTTCHGKGNSPSGVPGNDPWRLAPLTMKWEGLSVGEICRSLTDPKRGNMTLPQLVHHLGEDRLVGWAWNPGVDLDGKPRQQPPLTRPQLMAVVTEWIATGAACPA